MRLRPRNTHSGLGATKLLLGWVVVACKVAAPVLRHTQLIGTMKLLKPPPVRAGNRAPCRSHPPPWKPLHRMLSIRTSCDYWFVCEGGEGGNSGRGQGAREVLRIGRRQHRQGWKRALLLWLVEVAMQGSVVTWWGHTDHQLQTCEGWLNCGLAEKHSHALLPGCGLCVGIQGCQLQHDLHLLAPLCAFLGPLGPVRDLPASSSSLLTHGHSRWPPPRLADNHWTIKRLPACS